MCGLVGFLTGDRLNEKSLDLVRIMRDQLTHRGPDDADTWFDIEGGAAFGFRRLSIIDLSEAGHQPMLSANHRYAIMLNGEICNAQDIRAEIDATRPHNWRGHCDTEVLVEAIALWGFEATLRRLNGMFAIATWDRHERVLWLARDRLGKKPLHYGWAGDRFIFGSELKSLWPCPSFDFDISPTALGGFVQLGYVLGDRTIFSGMAKLRGGHILRIDRRHVRQRQTPEPFAYWRLSDVAHSGLEAQQSGATVDLDELETVLRDAVSRRMTADVPVGSFLSGGIDSSLITGMMAKCSTDPIRTFGIGFSVKSWNEAPHAKLVAEHIGTRHEELYITSAHALSVIPDLPMICDEPFADASIIPTVLLSRFARQDVTVALSGDGGDELFAGYERYAAIDRWLHRRARLPSMFRAMACGMAGSLSTRFGDERINRRFHLLSQLLSDGDPERFGELIVSQVFNPDALLTLPQSANLAIDREIYGLGRSGAVDRMTFLDTGSSLIDDILTKVDRASMASSLEVRCPLLDHRVVEMSWRFLVSEKYHDGVGKLPLRALLHHYVPKALVDRPKRGFGAPIQVWLQEGLRDWAENLMSMEALARHGQFNHVACRAIWINFTRHGRWNRVIWNLLMFQAWYAFMVDTRKQYSL